VKSTCAGKAGQKPVLYEDPLLEPILRETCGLIVYDEQFDRIWWHSQAIPVPTVGYSLRSGQRAPGACREETMDVVEQMRRFVDGCVRAGT